MFDKNPNKKAKREQDKKNRVAVPFNTGTRTHKSKRDYNRQAEKRNLKKLLDNQNKE